MKRIQILSESAAIGKRLRDILYDSGYTDISVSDPSAFPVKQEYALLIIYAKSHISEIIQNAESTVSPVILLLNPDCYALQIDRARHAGIKLLLMPVSPCMLLDTVQDAITS